MPIAEQIILPSQCFANRIIMNDLTSTKPATPNAIKGVNSSCIFVIDDEDIATSLIQGHLEAVGFRNTHTFNNPEEAADTLRFVRPDLILTDLYMPNVSGGFLTKLVRTYEHLHDVPLVVVTSESNDETTQRLQAAGADFVLHKPFSGNRLVSLVTSILVRSARFNQLVEERETEERSILTESRRQAVKQEKKLRTLYRK